ncbi:41881_t:CDS:2 [Gigaspora margarita]|uniref:41881_t:CDS:1 n=1 Tax=Gigaspora margarita TaxID=4874 RepID=A0ABN7VS67_GIGMA|nr:41881_t:CDS:2 [Gigaspora margarita]
MSDSNLEETSQTENSQEIDSISKLQNVGKEKICETSYKYLPSWSTSNMNLHLADEYDVIDFLKKSSENEDKITTRCKVDVEKFTPILRIIKDLVEKLIELLKPFNSATEYFSTGLYPTISFIHPLIEAMEFHYVPNFNEDSYDNDKDFQEILNFDSESESDDDDLRQLISPPEKHPISSNLTNISFNNMFKNIIFGKSQRSQESMDELDYYLDFR